MIFFKKAGRSPDLPSAATLLCSPGESLTPLSFIDSNCHLDKGVLAGPLLLSCRAIVWGRERGKHVKNSLTKNSQASRHYACVPKAHRLEVHF